MLHIILDSVEKTINKLGGRSKENAQCVARRNESENKNIKEKRDGEKMYKDWKY